MKKRVLALLLAFVLVAGLLPSAALADGDLPEDLTIAEDQQLEATPTEETEPLEAPDPAEEQIPETVPEDSEQSEPLVAEDVTDPQSEDKPAAQDDAAESVAVKFSKMDAWSKNAYLFIYKDNDGEVGDQVTGIKGSNNYATLYTPLYTDDSDAISLPVGDYWARVCNTNDPDRSDRTSGILDYGYMKVTVDESNKEFVFGWAFNIGNVTNTNDDSTGWEADKDFTYTLSVASKDSEEREVKSRGARTADGGYDPKNIYCLALEGDTVSVAYTPDAALHPMYMPVTVSKTVADPEYSVNLKGTIPAATSVTVKAPAGSTITFGQQEGYFGYNYLTPASTGNTDGVSATYTIAGGTTYFYRVSNPNGVTYWKFDEWEDGSNIVTVTNGDLHIGDSSFQKNTLIRDFSSNSYDVGSIFLNINEKNYLALNQGETYTLNVCRSWQAVEAIQNAETAMPDFHYTVIDPETGATSDTVSVDPSAPDANNSGYATLTANKAGTAIVLVTYDAMSYDGAFGAQKAGDKTDPKMTAIWPENTGVFVVTVGSDGSAIKTNMTINEGRNGTTVEKTVGDTLDGELDVLYYVDGTDGASYTFTPESGCTVSVLHPTLTPTSMTYSGGFQTSDVSVDSATGAVTVSRLTEGKHIIKVTKGGASTYQVITAKPLTYTVTDKNGTVITENTAVNPGDVLTVQYSGLFDPAGKMAGYYNFNTSIYLETAAGEQFTSSNVDAFGGVYNFAGAPAQQKVTVTVPPYLTSDTLELSAVLRLGGYGSPLGAHRRLDYSIAGNPDFTSPEHDTFMCAMPPVILKVNYDFSMPSGRIKPMDGKTEIKNFTIQNMRDEEGNLVYPTNGDFKAKAGKYTFAVIADGYLYEEQTITVSEDSTKNIFEIQLTRLGEDAWDGMTLTEPDKDSSGTYLISTGAELAWFANYTVDSKHDRAADARLTADIELSGHPFVESGYYYGTLDGAGHSINNFYIEQTVTTGYVSVGLFKELCETGTVKNLTVNGNINIVLDVHGSSTTSPGPIRVGTIAGRVDRASAQTENTNEVSVTNCISNVDITITGVTSDAVFAGGLIGYIPYSNNSGRPWDLGKTNIIDCANNGDITVDISVTEVRDRDAGGIAGTAGGGVVLRNVGNTGAITVKAMGADGSGKGVAGGIAGELSAQKNYGYIDYPTYLQNVWNTGSVTADLRAGGIASCSRLDNDDNTHSFDHLYNSGTVTLTSNGASCGGIFGYAQIAGSGTYELSDTYTKTGPTIGSVYQYNENYKYETERTYSHADGDTYGTKLNDSVLALTPDTVQESDREDVEAYYAALKLIPQTVLTDKDRADIATLEKLLGGLGAKAAVTVRIYDLAAKNAGIEGASATGTVGEYTDVEVPLGSTAAEAIEAVLTSKNVPYVMENTSYGHYLSSVNNLAAQGSGGWLVAYNGDQFNNLGLDSITVQDGGTLELHYSPDGGIDVGAASRGLPILTGLTLGSISVAMEKETSWTTGSAVTSYYLINGQTKTKMSGTGSEADPFVINMTLPAGTDLSTLTAECTTCLSDGYGTVTGLTGANFSGDVSLKLESRTGAVTWYVVKVKVSSAGSNVPPAGDEKISVSFRLIGSSLSREDIDFAEAKGDYKGAEYVTWIRTATYRLDSDSTVGDLFKTALDEAGLSYKGLNKNYISAITAPSSLGGFELKEFSNGNYTGWMYTVNGEHPEFGLNSLTLKDGDSVIWHYVNDYRYEVKDWSEGTRGDASTWSLWLNAEDTTPSGTAGTTPSTSGGGAGEPSTETTVVPIVTENTATAVVGDKTIADAITDAVENGSSNVTIKIELPSDVDKNKVTDVSVELPAASAAELASRTDADLTLETSVASVKISSDGLAELGKNAKKIKVAATKSESDGTVTVAVRKDDARVGKIYGGITATLPVEGTTPGTVAIIVDENGNETIAKKSVAIDGAISIKLEGSATVRIVDNARKFDDTANHWAKDAVAFVSSHELFGGTSENIFAPDTSMSRAMLATVLYRLEDGVATGSSAFADVPEGTWYTDAVTWASNAGIVTGTGSGFDPNGNVTREQLAAMLYRYAKTLGMSTSASGDLSRFSDGSKTSSWAKEAMSWAVGSGLISGKGNDILDPTGSATRAEVAVIMQRLIGIMVK